MLWYCAMHLNEIQYKLKITPQWQYSLLLKKWIIIILFFFPKFEFCQLSSTMFIWQCRSCSAWVTWVFQFTSGSQVSLQTHLPYHDEIRRIGSVRTNMLFVSLGLRVYLISGVLVFSGLQSTQHITSADRAVMNQHITTTLCNLTLVGNSWQWLYMSMLMTGSNNKHMLRKTNTQCQ